MSSEVEERVDKAFWQAIRDDEYHVPAGHSVAALTSELLSYLGSTDPDLREDAAYQILAEWIDRGSYSHAEMWEMATRMQRNLEIGLGEREDDTVFLRAYSSLILAELVYHDLTHPAFSAAEIHRILDHALAYLPGEQDLRGFVPQKHWAHAVAHMADCLMALSRHQHVGGADLMRILDTIAERITARVAHVYIYDEELRLARPVMAALQRGLLDLPALSAWLDRLVHPAERGSWGESTDPHAGRDAAETCARHNTRSFLYGLDFQLRTPGFAGLTHVNQRPAVADALLPRVESALAQIWAWC